MKKFKYYFLRSLPIILIVLIIATFAMVSDMQEKVDEMYEYNEDEEVNTEVTNKDNGTYSDTIENEVTNEILNEIKNEIVSNVTVIEKSPDTMSNKDREQVVTTDNKQKAVDLVKAKYGTSMNYFCDSVLASGEFVVAARMQGSSTISAYYKVNIETGKITLMY